MPDEPTGTVKDQMLAEVITDLPAGILDFLTTPLPAKATLTDPVDVDSAIICQAQFCVHLNDMLGEYAGLTPIAIPMFMAQLNTVQQNIMLASLEYDSETDAEQDFTVIEPADGKAYLPGDLRLQVKPLNGKLQQVAVESGDTADALSYDEDNGVFWGYLRAEDLGAYTATFTGLFVDDTTQSVSVSFTISDTPEDEPEDQEDGDFWPVEMAKEAFDKAYTYATRTVTDIWNDVDNDTKEHAKTLAQAAGEKAKAVGKAVEKVAKSVAGYVIDRAVDTLFDLLEETLGGTETRALTRGVDDDTIVVGEDFDAVIAALADVKNAVDGTYSSATQQYLKLNPHPSTGYTSCPEALKGAREAMLEKYGEGTVIEYY